MHKQHSKFSCFTQTQKNHGEIVMQKEKADSAEEEEDDSMWLTCALSVTMSACCGLRSDRTSVGSLSQGS